MKRFHNRLRKRRPLSRGVEGLEDRWCLDSTTVINEVMYHPSDPAGPEWIELYNQMGVDMDLSNWSLGEAVSFKFPEQTILPGGGYLVITADPVVFQQVTGLAGSLGPWDGRLDNAGETVELRDNNNRVMSFVDYDDSGEWPAAADGSGATLAKVREQTSSSEIAANWQASSQIGGTPGAANHDLDGTDRPLRFNEVAGTQSDSFWLELINAGTSPIQVGGSSLRYSLRPDFSLSLSEQTLAPGETLVLTDPLAGARLEDGERIYVYSTDGTRVLDAVRLEAIAQGRSPDGLGQWRHPEPETPGELNQFRFHDEIVINEIMYHHRPTLSRPDAPAVIEPIRLVTLDGTWRYNATGSSLPADWHQSEHPVGGDWQTGTGLIGFDLDAVPSPGIGTTLEDPQTNAIVAYYFETDFHVSDAILSQLVGLQLRHIIDDGAVFYLNGEEILRFNLPEGDIGSTTVSIPGVRNALLSLPDTIPKERLRAGTNRLSVSVHQSTPLSDDILFGMQLEATAETSPATSGSEFRENDEEWIELYNRSEQTVDLAGWQLDDAVRYVFPPSTVLEPGGFLVVAGNAATLQSKYTDLTTLVGSYGGQLANSHERIRLLDAVGNPVDEVHYFDGGRWDERADGWGSSLELVDPRADNSRGAAWQASDEAIKSEWHTYTYRGLGERTTTGEPSTWREFAFGFLDGAGEALLDDFSVIEDPGGTAKQLIQNGSFDDGTSDHWRMLGNHQLSHVVDDQGNAALYVVSDGATEYQGNQIETTLLGNARIDSDAVYEISFRAKWLSGSRQINSRLYFNRLPKTTQLIVPEKHGTPGQPNSRLQMNMGPTYANLIHSPMVPQPGEEIVITVEAADPDEVRTISLWYDVAEQGWQSQTMIREADGRYAAQIPGQGEGTVIQFYVEGTDRTGISSTFPATGRDSRALIIVDDAPTQDSPIHEFRLVMTESDSDLLHKPTNSLSNQRLGSTVIYQGEAFYDTGVRLKGSFVGRNAVRVGFNIAFNPDQKFRGVHSKVAVDRSTHANLGVDEILLKHAANHAGGIPNMYDDLIDFVAPKRIHTGRASLRMAGFDNIYLDSQFENGSEGTVYEYEVLRWATTTVDGNPESLKRAGGLSDPNGYANIDFRDQGDNKENYRWTNLIVSNRTRDDYSQIIALHQAMGAPSAEIEAATSQIMDVDQWMRTAAFQSLVGPGDAYFTGSNVHNFRLYARPDGRILYLPWDWDSAFQTSTSSPLVGGGRLSRVVRAPANLRLYYGHMLDIAHTTLNRDYMSRWTEHYGQLGGQNFRNRLNYIDARSRFVTERITEREVPPVEFSIDTPSPLVVADTAVTIQGTGWVDVREICLRESSESLDVTWAASEGSRVADTWQVRIPISFGAHTLILEAYDFQGSLVGSAEITVESTIGDRPLEDFLRVSELHYHPTGGEQTEFIELTNIGFADQAVPLELTGIVISEGPSEPFRFPEGTVLGPGQSLLVVNDQAAFQALYPEVDTAQIAGEFPGKLSNGGERISLLGADGTVLISFTYGDSVPWPSEADGNGASLQRRNIHVTANEASAWVAAPPTPGVFVLGDFDANSVVDATDVDLLSQAVRSGLSPNEFDLTNDSRVDASDRRVLIQVILGTTFGDSNLDRVFNSTDLVTVFQSGEYEDEVPGNSTWVEGDWNGDGEFDSRDLVAAFQAGRYEAAAPAGTSDLAAAIDAVFADGDDFRRQRAFVA